MKVYEIPLSPQAQVFPISLGGNTYTLNFHWNIPSNAWILDISDSNNNPIINGIPLVTGVDLLKQYSYLGINGQIIVQTDFNTPAVPTYANLGINGRVYFLVSS